MSDVHVSLRKLEVLKLTTNCPRVSQSVVLPINLSLDLKLNKRMTKKADGGRSLALGLHLSVRTQHPSK